MRVTSTEFKNRVGQYQDAAIRQPVEITKNGRTHTVLVSADHYALLTRGRVVRRIGDIDEDTLRAIETAEVPARFNYLDRKFKRSRRGAR